MSKMPYKLVAVLALISPLITQESYSQEQKTEEWSAIIGVGPLVLPEFEGSKQYRILPIPFARVAKGNYYIQSEGNSVAANIIDNANFRVGPVIAYKIERDTDIDNDVISLLQPISSTVEVGGFAAYGINLGTQGDRVDVNVRALFDVGDVYNGYTVQGRISYSTMFDQKIRLGFSLIATFADDNYNNTYFGVNSADALASRLDEYIPGASLKDIGTAVNVNYQINEKWGVFGLAGYSKLLSVADDSPIIQATGTTDQFMGNVGISYRF